MVWRLIFTRTSPLLSVVTLVSLGDMALWHFQYGYSIILIIFIIFLSLIDVMVHRQLHAAIDSDISYGNELTDKEAMNELCGGKLFILFIFLLTYAC